MKNLFTFLLGLITSTLVFAGNFTPGNIVVVRIGDGTAAPTSAGTAVFLDEYTIAGVFVQTIALPTADNGSNQTFTLSGSATSEGSLNLSGNGQYLTLAGYDAAPGTATVSSAGGIDRIIARVNAQGVVNTTTGIKADSAYKTNNIRGAFTSDGSAIWCSGNGSGNTGGTYYITFGSINNNPIQISTTPANTRTVRAFNNQLYVSSASGTFHGISSVGTGLPTTAGQTTSILSGFSTTTGPSEYAFLLFDMDANVPGVDVAYVADDRTTAPDGGIYKFSLVNGTWVSNGNITSTVSLRGLTGLNTCGSASLIATSENGIFSLLDNSGYNHLITGTITALASAQSNTKFRGVSFTPGSTLPTNVTAAIQSYNNVSCFGNTNGNATVNVSGGSGNYTYNWNTGATTSLVSNLAPGNYVVTVTDALGCNDTATVTITQPAALTTSNSNTNVSCNGGNNGAIDITVAGGTPSYSYNWSDANQSADRINLVAGNYALTITDAHNCTTTASFTITQPSAIVATANVTNLPCQGGSNTGAINISPSGGNGSPYTFNWSNSAATEDISNLSAGTYTVTIHDNSSCTATFTYTISQAGNLSLNPTLTNVSCNGGTNGSIALQPSGGTPSYSYNWGTGGTSASINNLSAGTYDVTVNDNGGCQLINSFTVTQPSAITASANKTDLDCYQSGNGTISLTVNGGTTPYSYLWNDGNSNQNRTNIGAGSYMVTITDANNCTLTQSAVLTQPDSITITLIPTNVSVFNGNNGAITLSALGGAGSYTYLWSNNSTSQNLANIPVGNYCVTVTDGNNCSATKCTFVDQPSAIRDNSTISSIVNFFSAGELITEISVKNETTLTRTILDVNGQLLDEQKIFVNGQSQIRTNISYLPAGLYIIVLGNDYERITQKIVIAQ